ncbi:hypothetical protein [Paraburkholderia sp. MM5477-R1]|uniref:hypothetical protein n=1 Tax=Paraburkholderia sp. MM5477-R1 TaxID=2991062 RepID=UPI003D1A4753
MRQTLEYTLCRTHQGTPLITLDSPLGNGQENKPDTLRALAYALLDVATQAEQQEPSRKHYRSRKRVVQF